MKHTIEISFAVIFGLTMSVILRQMEFPHPFIGGVIVTSVTAYILGKLE
jgi:hypothetical protein